MASEACSLVLGHGCRGLNCSHPRFPFRSLRFAPISCKARRNFSFQHKRQQAKKIAPDRPPLDVNFGKIADSISDNKKSNDVKPVMEVNSVTSLSACEKSDDYPPQLNFQQIVNGNENNESCSSHSVSAASVDPETDIDLDAEAREVHGSNNAIDATYTALPEETETSVSLEPEEDAFANFQHKRQQAKKIAPDRPPLDVNFGKIADSISDNKNSNDVKPVMEVNSVTSISACEKSDDYPPQLNFQQIVNGNENNESCSSHSVSAASVDPETDIDLDAEAREVHGGDNPIDATYTALPEETETSMESLHTEEYLSNFRLEDIVGMIRNAEKNIMLLNQARIRAVEDLDKILSEKEDLQGQVNLLEIRLAETDARLKVAAQEKIHVDFLQNQLENLKNELFERNSNEDGKDISYANLQTNTILETSLLQTSDFTSLSEALNLLREENTMLKEDIHVLKSELTNVQETNERMLSLEKERLLFETSLKDVESKLAVAQEDVSKLSPLNAECQALGEKVENLQQLLEQATKQADQAILVLQQNHELRKKVEGLEKSLEEANLHKFSSEKMQKYNENLQEKITTLEERLEKSDKDLHSDIQLYQESVNEFQKTLGKVKEESKRRAKDKPVDDMPWEFWSHILLCIDGWFLEKKITSNDSKLLRELTWKRDGRIRDAYLACKDKSEAMSISTFLLLTTSRTSPGLHIVHVAAEMAPVAKVGGLGDVVCGLSKALQKKGHLVEVVLPKYDCMEYDQISNLKAIDTVVESYFDGQLFKNKIWVGTVEGVPVYFIEPHHPAKFFWRGQFYGEHDDFKRFSFFSRAALELLLQAGKKPDIIHCHDWQTAFVAPLYWDLYAPKGLNSARICFTCHNFEYQGKAPASELRSCGLDSQQLNRPDRMQDNSEHDKVNPVKGAIVFSNIVTTVSPTYALEVRTPEGGQGLQGTLHSHSKKFMGILNGIDTDAWNPSTDKFLKFHFSADNLEGKVGNKDELRKRLKLSSSNANQPLVGCITRLVPQKGVHLIRHAIYRTLELGGQFVLLGSSPVPHIQREFEGIASHFQNHSHIRLVLKYDEALSHLIYAASDMFIIPSIFEPCGLTQMIAMRYGSIPITRKTGGLNDSVFDIDDDTIPIQFRNGFTFLTQDEQGVSSALERAYNYCTQSAEAWRQLVQKDMRIDFSWDSSAAQYEELYAKSVVRARAAAGAAAKRA